MHLLVKFSNNLRIVEDTIHSLRVPLSLMKTRLSELATGRSGTGT